jgi:hypothetical protein
MKTNHFLVAAVVIAFGLISASGFAQSKFDETHPRRAEVNARLNNQNARVDNKVADGKMSRGEAARIHRQDHAIRREERRDAAANGGHITKAEQTHINHQENHVSREIRNH